MLAHRAHRGVGGVTPDSREECNLRGAALGVAFAVAKVSTPFRYRFRYLVVATALHEIRWYHCGSLASSRTGVSAWGRRGGLGATPLSPTDLRLRVR